MRDGRVRTDSGEHRRSEVGRDLAPASGRPPRTLFAVGPITATLAALVVTLVCAWASVATWYIASREDLVAELIRRHAQAEARYEDHLGALRARLDRVASQKLIDQDTLEQRVASLVSRQVELETRQAVLADLAQRIGPRVVETGSVTTTSTIPDTASGFAPILPPERPASLGVPTRPSPAPDPFSLRLRGDAPGASDAERRVSLPPPGPVEGDLAHAERSLRSVEEAQIGALQRIRDQVEIEAGIMRDAIETAGLDPLSLEPASPDVAEAEGIGGPFIPLGIDADAGGFEALVASVQESLVLRDRLRRTAITIPFSRPVDGDVAVTSRFGVRSDPFTRRPAFHAGLDFRARTGEPVYATAAGRVVAAGRSGGYGKLVEIDHGNGLTTRFAHLSSIAVETGEEVAAGTMIGRAGSTGRSTGPHLHYETRIDGRAVDPQRFLRAASVLADLDLRL